MQGHVVAVHYDAKSPRASYEACALRSVAMTPSALRDERLLAGPNGVLLQGAPNCLHEIENAGWNPDYVYQISGMDYPIRLSAGARLVPATQYW